MKCSESWLREWVDPKITREELSHALTMGGLEVEEIAPVAQKFKGVVVGEVLAIEKHPSADRLQICKVDVAEANPLTIVCGATNVTVGMKAAVAKIGAELPQQIIIKKTAIRGVASEGMLCSASELGFADNTEGLMVLETSLKVGSDLWAYLEKSGYNLNDYFIDLSITPNRGDCLSVRGIAREVAALTNTQLKKQAESKVPAKLSDHLSVKLETKEACPVYVGRVIRNIKIDAETPIWLKERLRISGVRSINPIVDVTNYIMMELGQPMHAFDLNTLNKSITVRFAKSGEKITLLDSSEKTLSNETMVIADEKVPLAIAGVMGGLSSSVTLRTKDIFLESAYFSPESIARARQHYNLTSESAYRFERGVDPTMQREAIERATQLILDIAGGEPGEVSDIRNEAYFPKVKNITLPHQKVEQVLGIAISEKEIENIFTALQFTFNKEKNNWLVKVPPYRFDLSLPEDLIEEIARLYGYNRIPTHALSSVLKPANQTETAQDFSRVRDSLSQQGFSEIISYSFVEKDLQTALNPTAFQRELLNPITSEMSVMRTNLWPGLLTTLLYNQSRQQERIRLFEIGSCFLGDEKEGKEIQKIAGILMGSALPEQWGERTRPVDFFDMKGVIENLLHLSANQLQVAFKIATHPSLHPGQTAGLYLDNNQIGVLGALHPTVAQRLKLKEKVFLFELEGSLFKETRGILAKEVAKFPEIRRDLAILVNQAIPAQEIQDTIKASAGDWLKESFIFDVYQGKGVIAGQKSIALALILQHPTRTLVDDEVAALMDRVIAALKGQLGAELRS